MKDNTLVAIKIALDQLATGDGLKTNGKISAANLAREAGISKATLYRYFATHEGLRGDFEAVKRRGRVPNIGAPITVQDALTEANAEIKELHRRLLQAESLNKLRAQQILLLWSENKALNSRLRLRVAPHKS